MEVHISKIETEWPEKGDSSEVFGEQKLKELIAEGDLDFDGWAKLILEYADHMIRLCTIDKAVDIFERAVQSATYSVGVWVDYCGFAVSFFEDDNDIRWLFKRAMSFVGKDYLCHTLWDKYVEFEFSRQQWSSLANVCIQTLRFPSKKLHRYYESFEMLAATWKEEMQFPNDMDLQLDPEVENEVSSSSTDAEISCVVKDLLDASTTGMDGAKALAKYLSIGKQLYQEASKLDEKIHHFEAGIRRPYFH
ncbi:hypothetical protein F3Y22_tig00117005pilonHSYRG00023 [Hibiscus syriacus]|uniref:Uncharacterized protein n=1 Tax=Hibiscus syriacus TaxID=106335 RepID=A0A6A2WJE4_HIBSY|nr:hypothetical protein F3Y22_tig00117005pilonHSYRG00023 [Hibiscus syriacus]